MRVPPASASMGIAITATITRKRIIFFTARTSYLILRPVGGGAALSGTQRFEPGQRSFEGRVQPVTERRGLRGASGAAGIFDGAGQLGERGEPEVGRHPREGVRGRPHLSEIRAAARGRQAVAMRTRVLRQLGDEVANLGGAERVHEESQVALVDP